MHTVVRILELKIYSYVHIQQQNQVFISMQILSILILIGHIFFVVDIDINKYEVR